MLAHSWGLQVTLGHRPVMPMAFPALVCKLEQCQDGCLYEFIAAVQYMHVLRQLRRGFRTNVLH